MNSAIKLILFGFATLGFVINCNKLPVYGDSDSSVEGIVEIKNDAGAADNDANPTLDFDANVCIAPTMPQQSAVKPLQQQKQMQNDASLDGEVDASVNIDGGDGSAAATTVNDNIFDSQQQQQSSSNIFFIP